MTTDLHPSQAIHHVNLPHLGDQLENCQKLMAEEKGSSMLRPVGSNKCIKLYVGTYILVSFNENL